MEQPVRYLPGTGTLLGRDGRWLLLDRPLDTGLADRLWSQLASPPTGAGTLEELLAAVARYTAGSACAALDTDTGDQAVSGAVTLVTVGAGLRVSLPHAVVGAPMLPVLGGVVAAAALHLEEVRRRRLLIDGVPDAIWASTPGPPPTEPRGVPLAAAIAAATGLRADGDTMGDSTRIRPQPEGVHPLQQSTGETVLAVRCDNGHLNPPQQPTCRSCGGAVPPQDPLRVPRPPLGRLVLPDGQQVLLDRSVILGRRPEAIPGGETWPHLVELPADRTHLSRQHLLLELDGWQVVARDLGSRSGTVLRTPAGGVQRMQPQRPYIVGPGSVLVLADDYVVRVVMELSGDPA